MNQSTTVPTAPAVAPQERSYRQIVKATGIFGGVQVINIVITIIRSKLIAVLLGTTGVGLMGLYNSAIGMIGAITGLGINFSAVRSISEAAATGNQTTISRTIITLRRWVIVTGLLGALVTLALSNQLSKWTFGTGDYTWAFVWLSITLIFQSLTNGQLALLQGLRQLRQLAKANVLGSVTGLVLSLPLYYLLQEKAIVPAIILTAAISMVLSWYYSRKIPVEPVEQSYSHSFHNGIDMAKLGTVVMISGFASAGVMYLTRLYIGRLGGMEQVGLYAAAWSILSGYVDMVFSAMGTDYFPRLSAVSKDPHTMNNLVNEQAEMAVIILGPILLLMYTTLPVMIRILLSKEFLDVVLILQWSLTGILFKAGSWSIAFILLAKGDKKLFFVSELLSNLIALSTAILFYQWFQLPGLGIAFATSYLLYLLLVTALTGFKYQFRFSGSFIRLFLIQMVMVATACWIVWHYSYPTAYLPLALLLLICCAFSLFELRKRVPVLQLLQNFKQKIKS